MRYLLVPADAVQAVRGRVSAGAALDPRVIEGGAHAGDAALPLAVLDDPAMAERHEELATFATIDLDPVVAWPDAG